MQNIQFLVIYRFRPTPSTKHNPATGKHEILKKPVQLIGVLPYKTINESFWLSPSHLLTDNNLQGEIYDQIVEENRTALLDL